MKLMLLMMLGTMVCGMVASAAAKATEPHLAHLVFFSLKEKTPEARQRLVEACDKYLSGHDGTVYYSAGIRNPDLKREVNDQDFDVGLHVIFASKAAHDQYQSHPRHLKFIEENKATWAKVRVFDSDVEVKAAK